MGLSVLGYLLEWLNAKKEERKNNKQKIKEGKTIKKYNDIIKAVAFAYDLDPTLIKALIQVESSFNERAYRYEPAFYKKYILNNKKWMKHRLYNEPQSIAASISLCQVMFTTAVEYGFSPSRDPEDLYDPVLNINFGGKILSNKIKKYGLELGILAYNSGSPRSKTKLPEKEKNYIYLQKIAKVYKKFGGQHQLILKHAIE